MRIHFACLAGLLLLSSLALAQKSYEGRNITRGKIHTSDWRKIDSYNIFITKDSVEYYESDLVERHVMPLSSVDRIEENRGHWGTTGLWIGSGVGLGLGVIASIASVETTRTGYIEETRIQIWPIYVGTAVGALIGYFIGKSAADYRTVYDKDMSFLNNFEVRTALHPASVSLTYKIKL